MHGFNKEQKKEIPAEKEKPAEKVASPYAKDKKEVKKQAEKD